MSNFPNSYDDDASLPVVNDNIQDIGAEAINALRDAVFNIEQNIGIGAAGSTDSVANRLDVFLLPDGMPRASILTSLGLITLPITNDQISSSAEIIESKLKLDYKTQDLFNYIQDLSVNINESLGWISISGMKLEPHLLGAAYKHTLSQIDVSNNSNQFLRNKFAALRNNDESYSLINDINDELLTHQFVDGSSSTSVQNIVTFNGSTYPSNYGHTASSIFINTSRFAAIPQTMDDLQQLANFIDSTSLFLIGTRVQNLYSNGISKSSRSSNLIEDGYGQSIIPSTPAIAYLLNNGTNSNPFDDINAGDDIIEFKPTASQISSNSFDEKFALVKIGDIIRINYGAVEVQFIIKEKKYIQSGGNKIYLVRINGKNLFYAPNANARVDKPLFNTNKYGVLSLAAVNNNFSETPSLIVGSARGASVLGIGFNPNLFDPTHYNLYLALYQTGNPEDGYTILPAIDVTGDQGSSTGKYTLEDIVEATNDVLRVSGYNYRFTSFSYQGEFGIILSDSYNNVSFSIISAIVNSSGTYDQTATDFSFPNNVISVFSSPIASDPLGFGISGSNVASPPLLNNYSSAESSQIPTKIFVPLKRNTYYVNGVEKEKLNIDVEQNLDSYGDGYWNSTINNKQIFPGSSPNGRVQTTYRILADLSSSQLKIGKTIVVQPLGQTGLTNFGRFIIQSITFCMCSPDIYTDITVYDAVHAIGNSPVTTFDVGTQVAIYFNSDSVSFNKESSTDFTHVSPFKRNFEVYIDQNANTFTHERGRINASSGTLIINNISLYGSSEINKLDIIKISPKLKGYQFGSINKITLKINDLNTTTGIFSGFLSQYDGATYSHAGPLTIGKIGEIVRLYDETNIDYIDIRYNIDLSISNFTNRPLDFQLFPTLSLDEEIMLIGTCQLNDITNRISNIRDERQFGNVSEKQLSTSAINLITSGERLLHTNGVIRGFDIVNTSSNRITLTGGTALVNGNFININNTITIIPPIKEIYSAVNYNINWAICVNSIGELFTIPLSDYDSILVTPNNASNRIFTAFNPENSETYNLNSSTFSNIVEKRKDATILYITAATVSGTGGSVTTSLSTKDARKFINDGDSNFPITWTSNTAQGNFRTLEAINTWIKYNNTFNNIVRVRGTFDISTLILMDYTNLVEFIGDGAVFNISSLFGLVLINNVKIKNIQFNYTYDTASDVSYDTDNLVNYNGGAISIFSSSNLNKNIMIEGCTFTTTLADRYPFISVIIGQNTAVIQNLLINNNNFISQTTSTSDIRAAISIVTTYTAGTVANAKLVNCVIDSNICNQDQMIIITANIIGSPLSAINCVISQNICGTIAFTTRYSVPENFINSNYNFVRNKTASLRIQDNTCKLITTLDVEGHTFQGASFASNSGKAIIKNNTLSWLQIDSTRSGTDPVSRGGITVAHNTFNAFDSTYLNNFIGSSGTAVNYAYYDLGSFSTNAVTNDVEIFGNQFNSGVGVASNGTTTTVYNYLNHINTSNSARINNNIFNGITSDASNAFFIKFNYSTTTPTAIVTENKFFRGASSISKYITNTGTTGNFIVINNFFDSSSTGASTSLVSFGASATNPIYHSNKNQTDSFIVRGYVGVITLSPYGLGQMIASGETALTPDSYVNIAQTSTETLKFAYLDTTVDTRMRWFIPLSSIIPQGVSVVSVSVFATGTNLSATQRTATLILSDTTTTDTVTVNPLTGTGSTLTLVEVTDFPLNTYVNSPANALAIEFEFRANHSSVFTPSLNQMTITYRY